MLFISFNVKFDIVIELADVALIVKSCNRSFRAILLPCNSELPIKSNVNSGLLKSRVICLVLFKPTLSVAEIIAFKESSPSI